MKNWKKRKNQDQDKTKINQVTQKDNLEIPQQK